jgi:hypothetical protein
MILLAVKGADRDSMTQEKFAFNSGTPHSSKENN